MKGALLNVLGAVAVACLVPATSAAGMVTYSDSFTRLGGLDLAVPDSGPGAPPWAGGGAVAGEGGAAGPGLPVIPGSPADRPGTLWGLGGLMSREPGAPGLATRSGRAGSGPGSTFDTLEDAQTPADVPAPLAIFIWVVLGLFVALGVAQHRRVRTLRTRLPWSAEQREAILKMVERGRKAPAGEEEWRDVDSPW